MDAVKRLQNARRIVVKIGSAILVDDATGSVRRQWLQGLAADVKALRNDGSDVLVVSSGAIALGRRVLGIGSRRMSLEQSQAAAAVGQIKLARYYEEVLEPHNVKTGQVLLTLDDSLNRRRYLNSRSTLVTLLREGVVPIVNENDTVATDEIRFGDNDRLAAQVAVMTGADLLVLLSDVDGFYDKDPRRHSGARRLDRIEHIGSELEASAGGQGTASSKGGMVTKLMAARTATQAGCAMLIAKGDIDRPISKLRSGAACTLFLPSGDPQTARKHWINSLKLKGMVAIDDGACRALARGKSLLPAGVESVSGSFCKGDAVKIVDPRGEALGVGLTRYSKDEAKRIMGCKSSEITVKLGSPPQSALVHADDMVRWKSALSRHRCR